MSLRNRRRAGSGGGAVVRLPSLSPSRPGASQHNPIEQSDSQRRWARSSKEHSLVMMRPVDFLALTAAGHPETFTKSAAALEVYNQSTARGETLIPPHLELEIDAAGQAHVGGHEGRHRAAAMVNAGEGRNQTMPVFLRIKYWQDKWRDKVRRELGQGDSYTNTDYLLGWDNIPSVIYPQFAGGRAVYKADLDVVEPYVQDEARRAREAVGVRNPAYVHDNDSREWGFLDPAGKVVDGNKLSFSTRPYGALHDDLANHLHHVKAEVLMGRGWVRFAVLSSGEPVFGVAADTEELQWKALANIARYLTKSPHVSGEVKVDVHNYDGVGLHTARFEHEEHAARVLSRSATSRQFVGPEWRVYNPSSPYLHDSQVRQWGFIAPGGRIIDGTKTDFKTYTTRGSHGALAMEVLGMSLDKAIFEEGYVRFAVLRNGESVFTMGGKKTDVVLNGMKRVRDYLKKSPYPDGEVQIDIYTGGYTHMVGAGQFASVKDAVAVLTKALRVGHIDIADPRWGKDVGGLPGMKDYPSGKYFEERYEERRNPFDAHAAGWRWNGKWIIYGPTGRVLGTVWGRDIPAARHNLRPHVRKLGLATAQEAHLRPWPSATPEERAAADPRYGGVEIGIEQGVER